jgi:hypothetical protein
MSTPENQSAAQPAPTVTQAAPTNTLAIITLIAAFVLPLAGIITGHIALKQLKTSGESGHALAKWGLILSYIFVGLGVLFAIIWLVIVAAVVATAPMAY